MIIEMLKKMKNPLISVVIPTYNEEKDIKECLESLNQQTYKNFEVIIADDGSTDKTLEIVKKFKKVSILKQNHQGPGLARNLGAKKAKGKILILIDADMTFNKDYLKNLIKPILLDKKIIGTTHNYEIATNIDNKWSKLWGEMRITKDYVKNPVVFRAIRKKDFFELGGFDPKYGYADDQTFRYKYKIKPVFAVNTKCYHKNPETLKGTYKQARWIGASWKEQFLIFRIPIINYLMVFIVFLLYPFVAVLKAMQTKNTKISFKDRARFYLAKFKGYSAGVFRAIFLRKFSR